MRRLRLIRAARATYPIVVLCRVLRVARSAYYAWARRRVSARATADAALTAQIAAAHARSRRTYGARDFRATALNRLWIGDLTYVATAQGWLSLAVPVDSYSRRVIGWAMADQLRTELALDAHRMALRASPRRGLGASH